MKRSWELMASLSFLGALTPSLAAAERASQCTGERPWVALEARSSGALGEAMLSDLRAGLRPSNIEACESSPSGTQQPLARVVLRATNAAASHFSLDVTDSVTKKRIGRDLDLARLPADGRALALAVAAEELLRASWAELALRGVRSPETAAPPEVQAVVAEGEQPKRRARLTALGARLAFEHFWGGQTHYGGDVFLAQPLGRLPALLASVGARRALAVQAPHGSVKAHAFSADVGLGLSLISRGGFDLGPFAGVRALRLTFDASPERGARARASAGFAVTGRAGLGFAFGARGLLRSYSTLGAGLSLKSFAASDAGRVVTGASGLELLATTGVALELQ